MMALCAALKSALEPRQQVQYGLMETALFHLLQR